MSACAKTWFAPTPPRAPFHYDGTGLTLMDWFCGAGGSSQGAHLVPHVTVSLAANHWETALSSHAANFPQAVHYLGDIRTAPVHRWPIADIFWASPECPQWSNARGKKRDFATSQQFELFDGTELDSDADRKAREAAKRSRALMEEVPLYLRGVKDRGHLVLAGVVENVIDVRGWDQWNRFLNEIRKLGYHTRVIAMNSMHAQPRSTQLAPQSRDRLYIAYWHETLGRHPDWDKWLRPLAWCPDCDEAVYAMQAFKKPGKDMGRYRQQYHYRCPHSSCRQRIIEPPVLPAYVAIDWTNRGQRIGDRKRPLKPKTLARIQAGLRKHAHPLTTHTNALAIPPLLVPSEGRQGKEATSAYTPMRTQTTRAETGLAWLPFIAELRGGSSETRPITDALATVTASGNHHGLCTPEHLPAMLMRNNGSRGDGGEHCTPTTEPMRTLTTAGHQSLITWPDLLVPYYGNGTARPTNEPIGTLTTRDRYAIAAGNTIDLDSVLFRMLQPAEIARAMSFTNGYIVRGSKRDQVSQYGNAVTPNAAEIILCALVEAITGEVITRYESPEPLAAAA